jgi:hypothetical protein
MKKTVLFFVFSSLIFSAEFTVSSITELQNALTSSESNGQDDKIIVNSGTYILSNEFIFTSTEAYNLTIVGNGEVILDGNNTTRIFRINSTGGKTTLNNLIIQNGNSDAEMGGGLFVDPYAQVDILNSVFKNNSSGTGHSGGAIWAEVSAGDLVLVNTIFYNNSAITYGGAFRLNGSSKAIAINCIFANNSGTEGNGLSIFLHTATELLAINTIFTEDFDVDARYSDNKVTVYNSYLHTTGIVSAVTSYTNLYYDSSAWEDSMNETFFSQAAGYAGLNFSEILSIVDTNIVDTLNSNYSGSESFSTLGTFQVDFSSPASIISASLDLTFYNKLKIDFEEITEDIITNLSSEVSSDEVFVKNSETTEKAYLNLDFNKSNSAFLSVRDQNGINIIKSNSLNSLQLHLNDSGLDDSNISADFNLTKTLGSTQFGDLVVANDTWNLITIPHGLHTNSREIIKQEKATMIWGWEYNGTSYNWIPYPKKMVSGRGYWVRTRIPANTEGTLSNVIATDYNSTVLGDYNSSEINTSNLIEVVSLLPKKENWVLLGNSGSPAQIIEKVGSENNSTKYYFGDLLNSREECYFVSIYHWKPEIENWANDTSDGNTSEPIPFGAGFWTKQRLCNK